MASEMAMKPATWLSSTTKTTEAPAACQKLVRVSGDGNEARDLAVHCHEDHRGTCRRVSTSVCQGGACAKLAAHVMPLWQEAVNGVLSQKEAAMHLLPSNTGILGRESCKKQH